MDNYTHFYGGNARMACGLLSARGMAHSSTAVGRVTCPTCVEALNTKAFEHNGLYVPAIPECPADVDFFLGT